MSSTVKQNASHHMRVLEIRHGASKEDLKKAYRAKALQLHPDRQLASTSSGSGGVRDTTAQFKAVQAAYEFLNANPSALTTPSFEEYSFASTYSAPSSSSATTGSSPGGTSGDSGAKTPFFTEAELFGDINDFGDFGKKCQAGMPSSKHYSSTRYARNKKDSTSGKATPPPAEGQERKSFGMKDEKDTLEAIARDRKRAQEKKRVPLGQEESATSSAPTKSTQEILDEIKRQHREFESMSGGGSTGSGHRTSSSFRTTSSSGTAAAERKGGQSGPSPPLRAATFSMGSGRGNASSSSEMGNLSSHSNPSTVGADSSSTPATPESRRWTSEDGSSTSAGTTPEKQNGVAGRHRETTTTANTPPRRSGPNSSAAAGVTEPPGGKKYYEDNIRPRDEAAREYAEAREEAERKLDAVDTMSRMEREARKKDLDAETKREWEEFLQKLEGDREKENLRTAIDAAQDRVQKEAEADKILRDVAADRRSTRLEELSRQIPSTKALGIMPEVDLFLLHNLLKDRLLSIETELSSRNRGPCALCTTSARSENAIFHCGHRSVCELCFAMSLECPVCGATKKQ